jgi:hypothetical protein
VQNICVIRMGCSSNGAYGAGEFGFESQYGLKPFWFCCQSQKGRKSSRSFRARFRSFFVAWHVSIDYNVVDVVVSVKGKDLVIFLRQFQAYPGGS